MSGTPELVYFNVRGYAELPRLLFTALGIPYKETNVKSREDFLAVRDDLLFDQFPLLRMDGLNIVESNAVVRHIARKGGLLGGDPLQETRISVLYEGTRDFHAPFIKFGHVDSEEDLKKSITGQTFPRYLPVFNKVLKANPDHTLLVGSSPTLADYALLEVLLAAVDYFGNDVFAPYPEIKKFHETMVSKENVARYLKEIRKPVTTKDMVATATKIILGN